MLEQINLHVFIPVIYRLSYKRGDSNILSCVYVLPDPFLPRCCELATSSNDRQTKVNVLL